MLDGDQFALKSTRRYHAMIPFMHIGMAFALFTIIYFLTRRPLKLNDIIASLFLFFLALPMAIKVFSRETAGLTTPEMMLSIGSYPYLYGPFLYLYTKFEISEKPVFRKKYLLHFLPFIIAMLVALFVPGLNRQAQAVNLKNSAANKEEHDRKASQVQPKKDIRPTMSRQKAGGGDMMPPPGDDGGRMPPPDHDRGAMDHAEGHMMPPPGHDNGRMPPRPGGPPEGKFPPRDLGPGGPHPNGPVPPEMAYDSMAAVQIPGAVTVLYFIGYSVMVMVMLRKHRKNISEYFSYDSYKVNLTWLRWITICFVAAYSFVFLSMQLKPELFTHPYLDPRMTPDIALAFFIFAFSFFSIKQPVIFISPGAEEGGGPGQVKKPKDPGEMTAHDGGNGDEDKSDQKERRYEKSGLKESDARKYLDALERYMNEEKPYLDCELTIVTVSEKLGIPRHYLTQVINEQLNKNFFVYINEYRVNEAKLKMSDVTYRDHTILRIAYDSGFNSKSGFNIIFKKHTGFTPTEYRNNCAV